MERALMLDLDGVVRRWDESATPIIEAAHRLPPGIIERTAFEPDLLVEVTTGRMTKREWLDEVARRIGSHDAVFRWSRRSAWADRDVVTLAQRLREGGIGVYLLTNGTDGLPAELDALRLTDSFDGVFNSAEIGSAKPAPAVFLHVIRRLQMAPTSLAVVDDMPDNVLAAHETGMLAHRYVDPHGLAAWLRAEGWLEG
jgi:putative hydrolase of the HAD superfamily